MKVAFVDMTVTLIPTFSLGFLSAVLRDKGHSVFLIDWYLSGNSDEFVISELAKINVNIVGFHATSYDIDKISGLALKIKKHFPDIIVLAGGFHPTVYPEDAIKRPGIDIIIIGEAEKTLLELIAMCETGGEYEIPGIWYKKDGKIIKNPLRQDLVEIDDLPVPMITYDLWNMEEYFKFGFITRKSLAVFASRGCPFSCSFCATARNSKCDAAIYSINAYRPRSPEKTIEEILWYEKRFDINTIYFADRVFGYNKEHLKKLTDLYRATGLNKRLLWACQTVASIIDEEWINYIKDSGCFYVMLGLENSDENIRRGRYQKNISDHDFERATKLLKRSNITYTLNLIYGYPGEGLKDIYHNLKGAHRYSPMLTYPSLFMPIPGTAEYNQLVLKKDGVSDTPPHPEKEGVVLKNYGLGIRVVSAVIRVRMIIERLYLSIKLGGKAYLVFFMSYILNLKGIRPLKLLDRYNFLILFDYQIFDYLRIKKKEELNQNEER